VGIIGKFLERVYDGKMTVRMSVFGRHGAMTTVLDSLNSARFVMNPQGERVAVQLNLEDWGRILDYLELQDDRSLVRSAQMQLKTLRQGDTQGWIAWDQVQAEWDEDV
jgi:hypothetical protein